MTFKNINTPETNQRGLRKASSRLNYGTAMSTRFNGLTTTHSQCSIVAATNSTENASGTTRGNIFMQNLRILFKVLQNASRWNFNMILTNWDDPTVRQFLT